MADKKQIQPKLTIIADDLTGAMDTAGYFAGRGIATAVVLDPARPVFADVTAICTNSRADSPALAAEKVRKAVRGIAGGLVYKKIDSTLRGNIGAELAAVMSELGYKKAIVAPAFPAAGRTTVGGVLLVNGTPVAQTNFARDPGFKFSGSDVAAILRQSTGLDAGFIPIDSIRREPEILYHEIEERPENILVCDAVLDSDLNAVARAAGLAGNRWLLSGSAGLARELTFLLSDLPHDNQPANPDGELNSILLVVGSRNPVSIRQLEQANRELKIPLVKLDAGRLTGLEETVKEIDRAATEAGRFLKKGPAAVTASFSGHAPGFERQIAAALAEAAAAVISGVRTDGLFLSGGDTAQAVCDRLKAGAIQLSGEVEPGIPAGRISGGLTGGLRVVTKAGGFGTDAAIIKAIFYLRKGYL